MLRRLHQCLLGACLALGAGTASGQYPPPPGTAYDPYAMQPVGQPYGAAGWYPGQNVYGPQFAGPDTANDPVDPNIVNELLPPDRGFFWSMDNAFSVAIEDTSHGMWFRLEYIQTQVQAPGSTLLGAPLANVENPNDPFLVFTPASVLLTARVLDTSEVKFDHINGIRGTFGVPFAFGHFEANFWGTDTVTSKIQADELPATNPLQDVQVIGTSLLTNGQPGSTVVLYDRSFRALYSTDIFGAEANMYYNYRNPRLGLRFLPMFGGRHIDYDEQLNQRGEFDNSSGAAGQNSILNPPLVRQIDSSVDNDIYALQTGFRTEFEHQLLTLGMENKFGLGVNHYDAEVRTVDLRDSPFPPIQDDGIVRSGDSHDQLAPIYELQLYGSVHLNDSLRLRAGWGWTWIGNVSRADGNILYNDNGTANPPAVVARGRDETIWFSTFNIGGEWVLP